VARFNAGVRTGDGEPMLAGFADDAELVFEGVSAGPFAGRPAILTTRDGLIGHLIVTLDP
jgi:hypothetical protein